MSERLLTARQVAKLLGVSAETVLRWTRRGELPAFRLPGGAIRYDLAELERWLGEHATGGAAIEEAPATSDRARVGGYSPVSSPVPATSPLRAVTIEEDD